MGEDEGVARLKHRNMSTGMSGSIKHDAAVAASIATICSKEKGKRKRLGTETRGATTTIVCGFCERKIAFEKRWVGGCMGRRVMNVRECGKDASGDSENAERTT